MPYGTNLPLDPRGCPLIVAQTGEQVVSNYLSSASAYEATDYVTIYVQACISRSMSL